MILSSRGACLTQWPRYQTLLGCSGISLTNTANLYARFTTTVICNAMIQNSINACNLTADASRPVCAESCVSHQPSMARPAAANVNSNGYTI